MAIKYVPQNRNEIILFKRERAIKERKREEITDNTLIALRRINLFYQRQDVKFKTKVTNFNEYIKKQNTKKLVETINYFLAEID